MDSDQNRTYGIHGLKKFLLFISLFIPVILFAQKQILPGTEPLFKLYLIGDAGKDTLPGKALLSLKSELQKNPASAVVFLGDNVYPLGLNCENCPDEKKLLSQLNILDGYTGNVFFIPGNHDWKKGKWSGLKALMKQENFIEKYLTEKLPPSHNNTYYFIPDKGLPGPSSFLVNGNTRLIFIDSNWWLQKQLFHPVGVKTGSSKKQMEEEFFPVLDSLISYSKRSGEHVVICTHHPIYTNGKHGNKQVPFRFLINYTPFQIFGLLGLNRWLVQDIHQPRSRAWIKKLNGILDKYENIIYASGHDHNLQLFSVNKNHFIVSGSGSKLNEFSVNQYRSEFQNDRELGYIVLNFFSNGEIEFEAKGAETEKTLFRKFLLKK